jgi:FkbM family methyltransferase
VTVHPFSATQLLPWLERGAHLLRKVGLGRVVDRAGLRIGGAAARLEVDVDGLRVAGDHAGHLFYLRELAAGREAYIAEILDRLTPPGGFAVEAGAHIGYLSLHLARAVGEHGRLLVFEPNPEIQSILRRNLRRNGFLERVAIEEKAVGANASQASFFLSGSGETSSLVDPGTSRARIEVEVTTLDAALAGEAIPDIVKLDVEGLELAALEGMDRVATTDPDRPALVLECNPSLLRAASASPEALVHLLRERGFDVWVADEQAHRLVSFEDWTRSEDYVNLVCVRGAASHRLAQS